MLYKRCIEVQTKLTVWVEARSAGVQPMDYTQTGGGTGTAPTYE